MTVTSLPVAVRKTKFLTAFLLFPFCFLLCDLKIQLRAFVLEKALKDTTISVILNQYTYMLKLELRWIPCVLRMTGVFSLVICWKHYTHTYETLVKVNVLFVQVYLDVLFIWLVRRQTSEHLNPFRMQSHESSLHAFWHIHDISCITAVGAGSHFIQSITNFSRVTGDHPLPTGDGTSLFRKEFLHIAAW